MSKLLSTVGVGLIATAVTLGGVALASPASAAPAAPAAAKHYPTVGLLAPAGSNGKAKTQPFAKANCQAKTNGKTRSVRYKGTVRGSGNGLDIVVWECITA
ncbi:hypothetical protein [Amycolatopsis sp.]|uniref:hypothetical protein n=1 Tax=Amycolatopsis sp. TaxID=37632 RepID=UPI002D80BC46|nr:hypothetical protein [Amycolatopsis sp.]HET6711369.1 hypothetical protein [Amycolatopsis sp.]